MSDLSRRIAALSPKKRELFLKRLCQGAAPTGLALPEIQPDPAGAGAAFPQTYVQQAYLAGRSGYFDMGACGTNFFAEYEVTAGGRPFLDRYQRALRRLVAWHPSLRTVMLPNWQQQILADPHVDLPVIDLTALAPAEAEARLKTERQRMKSDKAPVAAWPLFEFAAYLLADGRIRILSRIDALIMDGTSNSLFIKELFRLIEEPDAALPPFECCFRDYVLALEAMRESELYARSRRYWLERARELPPAPEFPLAVPPTPLLESNATRRAAILLGAAEWSQFKRRAAQAALTPTAVVLTALTDVIAAWSASPRFTISLVTCFRLPFHRDIGQMIGNFNSITLLGADAASDARFTERARRLQTQLSTDLEHMYFSGFSLLQEWNRLQGAGARVASPVLANSLIEYSHSVYQARRLDRDSVVTSDGTITLVDGSFTIPQIAFEPIFGVEPDGSLAGLWVSVDSVYPPGMIAAMFEAFTALLQRLAGGEEAWGAGDPTDLLQGIVGGDALHIDIPSWPGAGAVRHHLLKAGASPGDTVAMLVGPGTDAVPVMAGAWAAGCTFLPLDLDWSGSDLQAALEQSGASILLDPDEIAPVGDDSVATTVGDCLLWRPGQGLDRLGARSLTVTTAGLIAEFGIGPGDAIALQAPPASDLWLTTALLALMTGCRQVEAGGDVLLARSALVTTPGTRLTLVSEERGEWPKAYTMLSGRVPGVLWSVAGGQPLPGFRVQVLDHARCDRPAWVPGDLFVDGASTGTKARFLPDRRVETVWPEIRVNGYRVVLSEVEKALASHPMARAAIVTEKAAYVLGAAADYAEYLRERLPGYMIPRQIVTLDSWPVAPTGEVELPAPPMVLPLEPCEWEMHLAILWEEILGGGPVGLEENLFTLGATSLTAIRLIAAVEERFGEKLPLTILADDPTVRGFARALSRGTDNA